MSDSVDNRVNIQFENGSITRILINIAFKDNFVTSCLTSLR